MSVLQQVVRCQLACHCFIWHMRPLGCLCLLWIRPSWSFLVLIAFSSLVLGLSAQMHIDVLFSSEQASCQLSRHSCLFHQPLIKLEHCGTCSRPISHLHQVYFARYCFTFSNSCMVRKTCGTLRTFTSAREPLLILFRGRRQGRQPLNSAPPAPHEWLALRASQSD